MAKKWTGEEFRILRQISDSKKPLVDQLHLLPGRTFDAAKSQACKNGIRLTGADDWSPEEIEILRKIWRGNKSIKALVRDLLPNRTYDSARAAAKRNGFARSSRFGTRGRTGYSWILRALETALSDDEPMTVKQLAAEVGTTVGAVGIVLKRHHGTTFRIGGWTRNGVHVSARWELGKLPDEPRPAPRTALECARTYRQRRAVRAGVINPFSTLIHQVAA